MNGCWEATSRQKNALLKDNLISAKNQKPL